MFLLRLIDKIKYPSLFLVSGYLPAILGIPKHTSVTFEIYFVVPDLLFEDVFSYCYFVKITVILDEGSFQISRASSY